MTLSNNQELIKTDRQGRKFVKAQHREAILDAFEATTMTGLAFANEHGINYSTFQHWVRDRRRKREAPSKQVYPLVEVAVASPASKGLEVALPIGAKVQLSDESQIPLLKTLLQALSC